MSSHIASQSRGSLLVGVEPRRHVSELCFMIFLGWNPYGSRIQSFSDFIVRWWVSSVFSFVVKNASADLSHKHTRSKNMAPYVSFFSLSQGDDVYILGIKLVVAIKPWYSVSSVSFFTGSNLCSLTFLNRFSSHWLFSVREDIHASNYNELTLLCIGSGVGSYLVESFHKISLSWQKRSV